MTDTLAPDIGAPPVLARPVRAPTERVRRRSRRLGPGKRIPYGRLLGPVLLLAIWALASATGRLGPRTIPAPWRVVHTGAHLWAGGTLRVDLQNRKIHPPHHRGRLFSVDGALNIPRSPQGYPLLVQAGSSEDGKGLASRYAEAVFTAQQTLQEAQAFYADLKARTRRVGRDPDGIKILPGIVPIIGSTEEEAQRREADLEERIVHHYAQQHLAQLLSIPVENLDLDAPLPDILPSEHEIEGAKSRFTLITALARRENLTVRQLIGRLGGGRGHRTFTGTPEQVADAIEDWFTHGAADGFNIMPAALPSGLELFVEHVVPILRARGLFRHEYTGRTLRDHYGLPRPANQHVITEATPIAL